MTELFDPEAAIAAVVNQKADAEREDEAKKQNELRAIAKDYMARNANELHGVRAIEMAKANLKHLTDPDEARVEFTRMAEGYALLGDFEKAVVYTQDEDKREEYQKILDAHDAADCNCPLRERQGKYDVPTRWPILKFADRTLTRCSRCGKLRC